LVVAVIAVLRVVNVIVAGVLYLSFCSGKDGCGSGICGLVVVLLVMVWYWW
jgi:hypothetical protein